MKRLLLITLMSCGLFCMGQRPQVVINEVLFNPARDGFDYVELYNKGPVDVALDSLIIGNRNSTGGIASIKPLVRGPTLLPPNQFCLITANIRWVEMHYHVASSAIRCELSSLPSYPDDEGTVVIATGSDTIVIDELHYIKDWHFELLNDQEGVSLERLNYFSVTQDSNNWASASSVSGYGTPGAKNSQHYDSNALLTGDLMISPRVFSPDNDGVADYVLIEYKTGVGGGIANGIIYDLGGTRVRYLIRNQIMGSSGQFKWDGQDDRGNRAANGLYLLVVDVYNAVGDTRRYKRAIIIAGRRA